MTDLWYDLEIIHSLFPGVGLMSDQNTNNEALLNVPFIVTPRQVNKFVGWTALGLPLVLIFVWLISPICFMSSISHFYYTPVGGDILVGSLTVIGAIMMLFYKYKGDDSTGNSAYNRRNARLAKLAGLCALGVAFAPTSGLGCGYDGQASRFLIEATGYGVPDGAPERSFNVPGAFATGTLVYDLNTLLGLTGIWHTILGAVHYLSAATMFGILGYFSFFVFTAVQTSDATENGELTEVKKMRNRIYRVAGGLIFFSIAALIVKFGLEYFLDDARALAFKDWWNGLYLTFIFEALGLIAFGVSWLLKARIFGLLEDPGQEASASRAT